MIKLPSYEQGSKDWLQLRRGKIGASDAAIILNCSPWNNPLNLWRQKLGIVPEPEFTFAMRRGMLLEEPARQLFNENTGLLMKPEVVVSDTYDWQMASLDGMSPCGQYIVEIKCPNKDVRAMAKDGHLPEHYMVQVQHQLAVTGLPMAYYFCCEGKKDSAGNFYVTGGDLVEVCRDERLIDQLCEAEIEFWRMMEEYDPPEEVLLVA